MQLQRFSGHTVMTAGAGVKRRGRLQFCIVVFAV